MNIKNLAMWAIIVFLTIGLYNMFKNPQSNIRSSNEVIFSEFLESVEQGEVLKVEIQGNNINGVYANGKSFKTYSDKLFFNASLLTKTFKNDSN